MLNEHGDPFCQETEMCQAFQTAVTSLLLIVPSKSDLPGVQKVCFMI